MTEHNRRKFLKIVGSTSAVSMTGIPAAAAQETTPKANSDLTIRNNGDSEAQVSVALHESADGVKASAAPIARNDVTLPSSASARGVVSENLDLDGGEYVVSATVDGEEVDERTWEIPAGGVPDWKSLSVHAHGEGAGKIYSNEI